MDPRRRAQRKRERAAFGREVESQARELDRVRGRRRNPSLLVIGNPRGKVLGRVTRIEYVHAEDGQHYFHDFGGGVQVRAMPDGSLRMSHPSKRLWEDM